MKDFTSNSFGLLIAYLLPGVVGFHALASTFSKLAELYSEFLKASSNVGLFFYVVLIALIIGLQLSVIRWFIYERLFFQYLKSFRLPAHLFKGLSTERKLVAYRAAVDELYRYHQFWGGFSIAFLMLVLLAPVPANVSSWDWYIWSFVLEAVTVAAAFASYSRYVDRVAAILEEGGVSA